MYEAEDSHWWYHGLRGVIATLLRLDSLEGIRQGSAMDIPFESNRYDIAISCDVLNDAGITDEMAALRELYRVLKPGGRLVLSLPAFSFLHGEHDKATSIARRYTRPGIRQK